MGAAVRHAALEAGGVSKRYGRRRSWALRDVHLSIPGGTITALVGPNGAGKSTLIRTWMGFERPTKGRVTVAGIDPQEDGPGALDHVGYVSQSTSLYRGLSVADHLALAEDLRDDFDIEGARARLEELVIPLDQRGGELSGGQAAQVALCIALGTKAPILLLDEPLASLDPLARYEFLNLLLEAVREQNRTVLLSSHIVSDVEAVCDEIVVLGQGVAALQSPIAQALAEHRLVPAAPSAGPDAVATFARPGEEPVTLIRSTDQSLQQPSLEQLVMGYLAAAKHSGASPAGRPVA